MTTQVWIAVAFIALALLLGWPLSRALRSGRIWDLNGQPVFRLEEPVWFVVFALLHGGIVMMLLFVALIVAVPF